MAEEFINIKNAPSRTLSHVIGHDANGKGGRQSVENIAPRFYLRPEDFGAVRYATRTAAISGTDATAAFKAMFAAWYAAGGGVIFLSGWYRVSECFQLDNTTTESTIGTQPPLKFDGIGGQGTYARPEGGAGIVWTAEAGDAPAKLTTLGRGLLILDNCVFASRPGSGNTKPFVHTTFTTIKTGEGFAFDGAVYGANAAEDGFILGGQTAHESDSGFDRRSPDCGFQGYGTVIDKVYFNGVRRLAVLQRYANAIRITRNTVWNTCGNNSDTGSAIEVNGAPIGAQTYAISNVISDNLVEVTHYKYSVHLQNAAQTLLSGNDVYDGQAATQAAVFVGSTCIETRIIPTLAPVGKPYVVDNGLRTTILMNEMGRYDRLNSLQSGLPGYPNRFGPTVFDGGTGNNALSVKPAAYSGAESSLTFRVQRADDAPTRAGETVFAVEQGGTMAHPLMVRYRTVANLPPAADWPRAIVAVSNGDSGAFCLAVSNGSSWLRVPVGSAVSET